MRTHTSRFIEKFMHFSQKDLRNISRIRTNPWRASSQKDQRLIIRTQTQLSRLLVKVHILYATETYLQNRNSSVESY